MNGWLNVLFPYQWSDGRFDRVNEGCARWRWEGGLDEYWAGGKQKSAPLGVCRAPLSWRVELPAAEYRYELLAGFVGVSQHPQSGSLAPEIGWAVRQC